MSRLRPQGNERGQTSPEYLGVTALVAAVIVAVFALGLPTKVAGALDAAVCKITGGCEGSSGGPARIGDRVAGVNPMQPAGPGPTRGETATTTDPEDPDGDGIATDEERRQGTDPNAWDSDGDGKSDHDEIRGQRRALATSDPLDPDSDDDGIPDGVEKDLGSNPNDIDTDGDGVWDAEEVSRGLDPVNRDSDGDGTDDHQEIRQAVLKDTMRLLMESPPTKEGAIAQLEILKGIFREFSDEEIFNTFWEAQETDDEFRDRCCQGLFLPSRDDLAAIRDLLSDPSVTEDDLIMALNVSYGTSPSLGGIIHGLIDGCGFAFDLCDGANALIYLAEGDLTNAGLSAGALIPVIGSPGKVGAKAIREGTEAAGERAAREALEEALEEGAERGVRRVVSNFADDALEHADFVTDVAGAGRTVTRSNASYYLARNMENMGLKQPPGTAAHHIIGWGAGASPNSPEFLQRVAEARRTLDRYGVDVDSAANGAFLPLDVHRHLHTKAYWTEVTRRLSDASSKDDVVDILHDIRQELIDGTFPTLSG
jgi:hypothetical protein